MKFTRLIIAIVIPIVLTGCGWSVHQVDLDAWVDVPVKHLDTHSVFLSLPLEQRFTQDGIEIRNYERAWWVGNRRAWCHHIFYIREGLVKEYTVKGNNIGCRSTNKRPQKIPRVLQ